MQLIEDKKALGEKCEALVSELKLGDQRRKDREAQLQEQHELVSPFALHHLAQAWRPCGRDPRTGGPRRLIPRPPSCFPKAWQVADPGVGAKGLWRLLCHR